MKAPVDPDINNFKTQFDGVDVRIYDPVARGNDGLLGPVLIYIHGGGWVLGDIDSYDLTSEFILSWKKPIMVVIVHHFSWMNVTTPLPRISHACLSFILIISHCSLGTNSPTFQLTVSQNHFHPSSLSLSIIGVRHKIHFRLLWRILTKCIAF